MWKKRCERTYWAGALGGRLRQRTFWPKQPLTPGPKKPRPLRRAAGEGEGRSGYAEGGTSRRSQEAGARGAVAPRGDVRAGWSRGLPLPSVRMVNNRERSVEGNSRCSLSLARPSPHPRPLRSPGMVGLREGERER